MFVNTPFVRGPITFLWFETSIYNDEQRRSDGPAVISIDENPVNCYSLCKEIMQTLDSIQKKLTSRKAELFKRFSIKNLAIFGSSARNEQSSDSDVDMLVECDAPVGIEFIDLADQLESILELRVDLVSRTGIKPKYFKTISNDLRYV